MTKEEEVLKFNYLDEVKNFKAYGQRDPPAFPIENIGSIPIYIVSPTRDTLADTKDVHWLYETLLPNY